MTRMAREAAEAADGAMRQIARCGPPLRDLGRRLRDRPPAVVVTCARGSSDHAATYGKYLLELTAGCVVASVGPSVATSYRRAPIDDRALFIAISQSGASPDLLALTAAARAGGALTIAFVNDESSPLATACDVMIPLCAGEERSIAATKSFLLAGVAFLQLAAAWTDDAELHDAVAATPAALAAAAALDWTPALQSLVKATSLYVLGRGVGLAAALEIALKLKETCRLHGEAFSLAEVLHGPLALVDRGFPIIALGQDDATTEPARETLTRLVSLGADVRSTLAVPGTTPLPTVPAISPLLAPLCQVQSCYLALPALAAARGLDPDTPPHLAKITRTR